MSKIALICGVTGQDGALLAKLLLTKGYQVIGLSRAGLTHAYSNLKKAGVLEQVNIRHVSLLDKISVSELLSDVKPDEIYNLSGQSSVGLSFAEPVETFESHAIATMNLLEAVRLSGNPIKLFNAGSGECFGDTKGIIADESTPFNPSSPYAVAKAAVFWQTKSYRDSFDLYACTGVLFNHESVLRPERFVTRKIINAVCAIAAGNKDKLTLGDLSVKRDWGWAPEYVEAMWLMLQQDEAEDYVIATGESHRLEEFVIHAFECVNLNWKEYVESSSDFLRKSDIPELFGNPAKARDGLGWAPSIKMTDVVEKMIAFETVHEQNY